MYNKSHDPAAVNEFLADGSDRGIILNTHELQVITSGGGFKSDNLVKQLKCHQLRESIISDHWGFSISQNHFMFKPLNRKIVQLVESKIANRIVEEIQSRKTVDNDGSSVLSMEHLGIWFLFCAVFFLVFICFICDMIMFYRKSDRSGHFES